MNEIKKTTLHPDNQPNVDLYPKTSADQVEELQAFVEQYSSDSIKVTINVPKRATNGNITEEQLAILQASDLNYIEMVNDKELYYLNDNGHTDGYLTYSHVGIENSKTTIKTLTITVSAKSFVIVTTVVPTDAGGKLYLHSIKFTGNCYEGGVLKGEVEARVSILNSNSTPFTAATLRDYLRSDNSISNGNTGTYASFGFFSHKASGASSATEARYAVNYIHFNPMQFDEGYTEYSDYSNSEITRSGYLPTFVSDTVTEL